MSVNTGEVPRAAAAPRSLPRRLAATARSAEDLVVRAARMVAPTLLRVSLGVVFVWFGALKVADVTPVGDLVAGTVPWLDRSWFVPALGAVEVVLGLALLVGRFLTVVGAVLVAHLCGTFLVLVMEPQLAFTDNNPLLLTTIGEFVIKNVVLISAGVVLIARLRDTRSVA